MVVHESEVSDGITDGGGAASLPLLVPDLPSLSGVLLAAQAFVQTGGPSNGVATVIAD